MKIVIIGAGKVGCAIAKGLSQEKHDVVIVDRNSAIVNKLVNELDILGVAGDGSLAADLREAGAERADVVISVTRSDQTNLLCCLVAKALGAKHTIARVREPAYSEQFEFMRTSLGIDMLVNSDRETADEIARHLRYPNAEHVETFGHGKVDLVAVRISDELLPTGEALSELVKRSKFKLLVCAIERDGEVIIPDGKTVIYPDDVVYFTGDFRTVNAVFDQMGVGDVSIGNMIVVGGSRICQYLSKLLISIGIKVKIIEEDAERCKLLATELPKATVVCGDGGDKSLLLEEGIDKADSFVTLTGSDELNILLSLFAKSHDVDKVITKVSSGSFMELTGPLELGSVVSPVRVMSDKIIKYTRSLQASDNDSVCSFYRIVDEKAEAIEFDLGTNKRFVGKALKELRFKKNVIIAAVIRGRELIVPDGSTVILPEDRIIVISAGYQFSSPEETLQ